ncbi:MAG: YbhN family protein [Candidatus Magasanikbacteria bacterium]
MKNFKVADFLKSLSDRVRWKKLSFGRKLYYGIFAVFIVLAIHFIFSRSGTIKESLLTLQSIRPLYIFLALASQVISYLGSGYIVYAMLKSFSEEIPLYLAASYEVASESVGVMAGGVIMTAASMYHFLSSYGVDKKAAAVVGWAADIANLISHTILSIIGLAFLVGIHSVTSSIFLQVGGAIFVVVVSVSGFVWFFSKRERVDSFSFSVLPFINYFLENPIKKEKFITFVDSMYEWWHQSSYGDWLSVSLGEVVNVFFDLVTIYVLAFAIEISIPLGLLVAGYAIPFLAGKIIPGGFGIIEGSMVTIYLLGGVPGAAAAFLVFGFRLFSLWIPLFIGITFATKFGWSSIS